MLGQIQKVEEGEDDGLEIDFAGQSEVGVKTTFA